MYLIDGKGNKKKVSSLTHRSHAQFAFKTDTSENFGFGKTRFNNDIITLIFGILFLIIGVSLLWKYMKNRSSSAQKSKKETSLFSFGFPV